MVVQLPVGVLPDPAALFFYHHPTAEEMQNVADYGSEQEMLRRCSYAMMVFNVVRRAGLASADPDLESLVHVSNAVEQATGNNGRAGPFVNAMCRLALKSNRANATTPASTKKENVLDYYLRLVHGAKDEGSDAQSHKFLPSSLTGCGTCSNCGEAGVRTRCSGCQIVEGNNIVSGTFYCGRQCQVAHRKEHKASCNQVRALRRASSMFTELYLDFLRNTWSNPIDSVDEEHGLTVIRMTFSERRAYLGLPMLWQFPESLASSEEQALAVLANSQCRDVLTVTRMLFEVVVRRELTQPRHFDRGPLLMIIPLAACASVEEVIIHTKNMPLSCRFTWPGGRYDFSCPKRHHPLRITLRCGKQFAFDPTAFQYGWRETLAPWSAYTAHRAQFLATTTPADAVSVAPRPDETSADDDAWNAERITSKMTAVGLLADAFDRGVAGELGLATGGAAVRAMLIEIDDEKFRTARAAVMAGAKEWLRDYLDGINRGPTGKMYFDADKELRITRGPTGVSCLLAGGMPMVTGGDSLYLGLQKVWLTEEQYEALKDDDDKVWKFWRARFIRAGLHK